MSLTTEQQKLFDAHVPKALAFAHRVAIRLGATHWLEEMGQEALVELGKAVQTYRADSGAAFATYVYSCVEHRLLGFLRTDVRYSREMVTDSAVAAEDDESGEVSVLELIASDCDLEEAAAASERIELVHRALQRLEGVVGEKLALFFWHALTADGGIAEAERIVGLPRSNRSALVTKLRALFIWELQEVGYPVPAEHRVNEQPTAPRTENKALSADDRAELCFLVNVAGRKIKDVAATFGIHPDVCGRIAKKARMSK